MDLSKLSLETLLIIVAVNFAFIGGLVWVVLNQRKQINSLQAAQKPRYGFLGKPLYSLMTIGMLAGGFGIAYLVNKTLVGDVVVRADVKVELDITAVVLADLDDRVQVQFKLIPLINGELWGEDAGKELDVFWTLTGKQDVSRVELDRNATSPSSLILVLPKGKYAVQSDLFGKDKHWSRIEDFDFNDSVL